MATKKEVRDRIINRLARQGNTALESLVDEELAVAQETCEQGTPDGQTRIRPWFLVTERATFTLTIGEARVPRPSDFLMEYEPSCLWIVDDDGKEWCLKKVEFDDIVPPPDGDIDDGFPEEYAFVGDYFWLDRGPDKEYNIKTIYYATDTNIRGLSDSQTNEWLTHADRLLAAMAGSKIAGFHTKDTDAMQLFDREFQMELRLLMGRQQAMEQANRSYVMRGK